MRRTAAFLTLAPAFVATLGWAAPASAWQVTWLGHAGFVVQAKDGTQVLIDPWLANPKFPKGFKLPAKVDGILVSHGHFDHAGSATELSKRYHAPVVGCFELVSQLAPAGGPEGLGGNVGGGVQVKGIHVAFVPAVHSSSLGGGDGQPPRYAGAPMGFVLTSPGEAPLYHAGDTGLMQDFKTIADVHHPQVAMLPIGGLFTMDPGEAAIATRWLGVRTVVPMHYGTFPALTGTPAALGHALGGAAKVDQLVPGKTVRL